jgi:hypothetical protein
MVRRIDDKGGVYHESPYTWEEEQALWRQMSPQRSLTRIHAGPRGPQPPAPPAGPQSRPAGAASPDRLSQDHPPRSGASSADPDA